VNINSIKTQAAGHLLVGLGLVGLAVLSKSFLAYAAVLGNTALLADSFFRQTGPQARAVNFRIGTVLVLFPIVVLPLASQVESALRPGTIDGYLRGADLYLHLDGFGLSRFCLAHTWAKLTVIFVYAALPFVLALAWIANRPAALVRGAIVATLLVQPFYLLFPAVGPQYAFGAWPLADAQMLATIPTMYARNCVPSLHFTWAVLAAQHVAGRWRWLFVLYALLMAGAAVAGGEHYGVDILAALPFLLLVHHLAPFAKKRTEKLLANLQLSITKRRKFNYGQHSSFGSATFRRKLHRRTQEEKSGHS